MPPPGSDMKKSGLYLRAPDNKQICYNYSRAKDLKSRCKDPCPTNRAHICEICRGGHSMFECPNRDDYLKEKDANKSKGTGKGKKK